MAFPTQTDNTSLFDSSHGQQHRAIQADTAAAQGSVQVQPDGSLVNNDKIRFTAEGGMAVKLTNKTGGNSIKGYLVHLSGAVNNAVIVATVDDPDIVGVFYEDGIADGAEAWIVVSGIADIYFNGNSTRGHFMRNQITADSGTAGMAISEALPSPPLATDKHFHEIGHVLETRTGAGLAKGILHFN